MNILIFDLELELSSTKKDSQKSDNHKKKYQKLNSQIIPVSNYVLPQKLRFYYKPSSQSLTTNRATNTQIKHKHLIQLYKQQKLRKKRLISLLTNKIFKRKKIKISNF